jgi:hypothetical protein
MGRIKYEECNLCDKRNNCVPEATPENTLCQLYKGDRIKEVTYGTSIIGGGKENGTRIAEGSYGFRLS